MKRHSSHLLIAILVVAAILRFNHIEQPLIDIFSWRQSSTAMMAENFYLRNWNIFYPEVNWTGPGPNYQGREFQTVTYIAALLYRALGQQEWIGRTIAVLFGLWGIFALYQLVRRVWDEDRAIASAAVMALLPGSIFVERSFLPDPAMVALVTTSMWLFVMYLQTDRSRYLILASIFGAWGFLTKIPGLIVGIPMLYALFKIFVRRQKLQPQKFIPIGIAAICTLAPVISYYLWARHLALTYPPHHFAGSSFWLWDSGLQAWLEQKYFLPQFWINIKSWLWTAPIIILLGIGLFLPLPKPADQASSTDADRTSNISAKVPFLFHCWMLANFIYYLVGAKELVSNPWNLHLFNPAAAALAGHALITLTTLSSRFVRSPTLYVLPLSLLLLVSAFGQKNLKYLYAPYANDSYELGLMLRQVSQPDDLIITLAKDLGDPVTLYYSRRRGWVFPPAQPDKSWGSLPENESESIKLFNDLRQQGADWVGMVDFQREDIQQRQPTFFKHIDQSCEKKFANSKWVIYYIPPLTAQLTS